MKAGMRNCTFIVSVRCGRGLQGAGYKCIGEAALAEASSTG